MEVEVSKGRVTLHGEVEWSYQRDEVRLHGSVRSLSERRIAQRAAEATPGVARVENDIVVAS